MGFSVSRHSVKVDLGSYEPKTCFKKTLLDITGWIKRQRKLDILSVHSKYVASAPLMLMLIVLIFLGTQIHAL